MAGEFFFAATTNRAKEGQKQMTLEKDRVRADMMAAALRMMDEGGVEQVRARAIATEVGVSVGTIYNFFGSLEGLVEAVCATILEQFRTYGRSRLENGVDEFRDQLAGDVAGEDDETRELMIRFLSLAAIYMDFCRDNDNRWSAMLAFNRDRAEGAAPEWYLQKQQELFRFVGEVLDDTRLGADAESRNLASRALWSGVHGIVSMSYLGQVNDEARKNTWAQIVLLVRYFTRGLVRG